MSEEEEKAEIARLREEEKRKRERLGNSVDMSQQMELMDNFEANFWVFAFVKSCIIDLLIDFYR